MPPIAYVPPDLRAAPYSGAPDAKFAPAPRQGVLPEGFFSTSNLPTYVRVGGEWRMPRHPRMDCALVLRDGELWTVEARKISAGEPVALGLKEDGTEGILVWERGFLGGERGAGFRFMSTEVSRERPVDYATLAGQLIAERNRGGYVVWVVGPALVHARARNDLVWFIQNGFVGAVLAGNAVAVHDIEAAMFGTTLGMDHFGQPAEAGHGLHLRAINRVAAIGSIEAAVSAGEIRSGVMHALTVAKVPYVLAGSIRDDGPLPGVYTDALAAQDAMRAHTLQATGAVFIATALHAIAVGNMLPAFHTRSGAPEPMFTLCVDQTEFVVNKLKDRGTHQAYGVVTNAQDFMLVLRHHVEALLGRS